MSDIVTIEDALEMISSVASVTGRQEGGAEIVRRITTGFAKLSPHPKLRTLYLIWRKPWRGAGSGTFINSILEKAGFENALAGLERYPELSGEMLKKIDPQVVLLSSEPFPFSNKHIEEITSLLPKAKAVLVDGEMFSWYGSRLIQTPGYVDSLEL